jgi:hypothetical protein
MTIYTPTRFWKLWKEELKVSFPKKQVTDALQSRWQITHSNVLTRLKKEKFMDLTADIYFLYENYGIGYTIERGFFYDEEKHATVKARQLETRAKKLGLSK